MNDIFLKEDLHQRNDLGFVIGDLKLVENHARIAQKDRIHKTPKISPITRMRTDVFFSK